MRRCVAVAVMLVLVPAAPAGAATQIGQTFSPPPAFCGPGGTTNLQSGSPGSTHVAPTDGVITTWSVQTPIGPPSLKLKLARPLSATDFTIVGQSTVETPVASTLNSFATRLPAHAGDVIGFAQVGPGGCLTQSGFPGYIWSNTGSDVPPGTTASFAAFANNKLDISASLEPDVDGDGFGDETQDQCPTDDTAQGACPVPDTTITKRPKNKTRKRTATFEFSSSIAGASFDCSLDGAAFAPCSSPDTLKVKKGKHHFEVRATAKGQTDGSPATDDWKVRKKRR